jgi:hypothetical protein
VETVRTYCRKLLATVVACVGLYPAAAQDSSLKPVPSQSGHADSFFSGTVVELASNKLTVSRTVLGKPAEKRSFVLNGDTKVEGKLAAKTRVTVRYTASEQGDVALSILVRDKADKDKKK